MKKVKGFEPEISKLLNHYKRKRDSIYNLTKISGSFFDGVSVEIIDLGPPLSLFHHYISCKRVGIRIGFGQP